MGKRWWEWSPIFRLEPKKTALLVIDMQRGFLEPSSPLYVPMAREQLSKIAKLVKYCKSRSIPVIFTRFVVKSGFNYPVYWARAPQRGVMVEPPERMFWPEKPESQIASELGVEQNDVVLDKFGYDAFAGTSIDQILRSLSIEYLIITGTVTNWCVDSTVRGAFHRFYKVIVAADGVSTYDHAGLTAEQWQEAELDLFAEAFGRVATIEQIISELEQFT